MPIEVILPKVDMDMSSGQLSQWLCASGDAVVEGRPIFVIETDKSGMEVEAVASGKIAIIEESIGNDYPVGTVMAYIYADNEQYNSPSKSGASPLAANSPAVSSGGTQEVLSENLPVNSTGCGDTQRASPAARRLARENKLVLSEIEGSARRGRIVKSDVVARLQSVGLSVVTGNNQSPEIVDHLSPPVQTIPHSAMRKTIAARLSDSVRDIPSYQLTIECDCTSLLRVRKEINESADPQQPHADAHPYNNVKLSLNDLFIKALALALRDHPLANSAWTSSERLLYENSDIGIAVALPDGLITPILRNAEKKTLAEISTEAKDLARRAIDGKLDKSEYQGGSCTISNLGMFGIPQFSSIINPPQASILSIGAVLPSPKIEQNAVIVAPLCKITFTFDHRLIDGAIGAAFANTFKAYVENAVRLAL